MAGEREARTIVAQAEREARNTLAEANAQANAHTWTPGMLKDMVAEHGGLPLKGLLGSTETGGSGGAAAAQPQTRTRAMLPPPPAQNPSF